MALLPLVDPKEFVGLEGITHLCSGGESPWLKRQRTAYDLFASFKSASYSGRSAIYEHGDSCRHKIGQLWDAPANRIGFLPSAAEGMNYLARGIDWQSGDNIVTTNLEFPSVAYAWKNLPELGVEIRFVPHQNWIVEEADLLAAVDERTRLVAVSQVSFYTGQNLDVSQLADGLKNHKALLAIDTTHASGVVRVDATAADLCVSSSYKWLLATHGTAPCYLSEKAEECTRATSFGWRNLAVWPSQGAERVDAVEEQPMPQKLEAGNPAMVVILFLEQALDLILETGIERIENHARDLSNEISEGLAALDIDVITPATRARRSGNTCFRLENAPDLVERLTEHQVYVWGEYGRVRVSGHLYNGSADIVRLCDALKEIL